MDKDYVYVSPTIGVLGLLSDKYGFGEEADTRFRNAFPLVCLEIKINGETGEVDIERVLLQYRTLETRTDYPNKAAKKELNGESEAD